MGKVGSNSVCTSLREARIPNPILQLHYLSADIAKAIEMHINAGIYPPPYHLLLGRATRKIFIRDPSLSCKIISLVRDPIARVISGLFENPHFAGENIKTQNGAIDSEKALKYLARKICEPSTFKYTNEWFDRELKQVFNIDVFEYPFPVDTGYAVYRNARAEVLLIRLEDLTSKGGVAISQFLHLDVPLVIQQANSRNESKDSKAYQQVLDNIRISPAICKQIYSSRLARHFYSNSMVERFISRWAKEAS